MDTRDTSAPVQGGDVFAGKYVIDRVIGAGAMGIVVAANHAQLGEKVVLKFLRADVARRPDLVARFLREARSAVRIRSEHVARILDVGTTDNDLPYIVMEHLEGCDLQEVLRTRGALPVADAVEYVAQACLAMVEAHALGVVHRDLKPSNIFLCQRGDGSPLIKVLDFGISKVIAEAGDQTDLTSTNGILGSPIYISPEQARSARSVDARADVWSLGVILHHLLVGRPPFIGDSITEVLSAILFAAPERLSHALPGAPAELEAILLRCLEKEVDQRTPSVAKLALALAPWAQADSRLAISRVANPAARFGEGIARPPAPAPEGESSAKEAAGGATQTSRLGRGTVAMMVGLAIALVVGGAVGTTLLGRAGAPGPPTLPSAPRDEESTAATRRAAGQEARSAVPLVSLVPAEDAVADVTGEGGPSAAELHASKPAKSNASRAPAVGSSRPAGPAPRIDPGTLTFDLGTAPSTGRTAR